MPSVGSARRALTPVTTRSAPRPVCPMTRPIGIAISAETATATPVYCRCSRMRAPIPAGPAQFSAEKMYSRACCRKFMSPAPAAPRA